MTQTQNGNSETGSNGLLDWRLGYQAEQQVLHIQTSGPIDKTSFPVMLAAAVAAAGRHHSTSILADHRNSAMKLNPLEIYYAPRVMQSNGAGPNHIIALVFAEMSEDLQFMENVCRNSGLSLAVFTQIDAALQWLSTMVTTLGDRSQCTVVDVEQSKG